MGTAHHLHVCHPRGVPPRFAPPLALPLLPVVPLEPPLPVVPLEPRVIGPVTVQPAPVAAPEQAPHVSPTVSARCREKGCIFPAVGRAGGKCVHHYREEREPTMYLSKQPTRAALDHGKFIPADEELMFGSRQADRRRFEAEREAFFES